MGLLERLSRLRKAKANRLLGSSLEHTPEYTAYIRGEYNYVAPEDAEIERIVKRLRAQGIDAEEADSDGLSVNLFGIKGDIKALENDAILIISETPDNETNVQIIPS